MFEDSSCDSLGTRTLPVRRRDGCPSEPPDGIMCGVRPSAVGVGRASASETLPAVALSDVSFFNDSADDDDGGVPGTFQQTLAIVKPEAAHLMYKIETVMERNGFVVKTKEVLRLTREQAAEFYHEHAVEMYFPRLIDHMCSGPIVVYVLAKKNCVDEWQRLIGPADVPYAKRYFPVSLRAIYGTESTTAPVANAFHGSRSAAAADKEIRLFFPNIELESMTKNEDQDDTVQYINTVMIPAITECLSEMFEINPSDPLRWFGNQLLTKKFQKILE